ADALLALAAQPDSATLLLEHHSHDTLEEFFDFFWPDADEQATADYVKQWQEWTAGWGPDDPDRRRLVVALLVNAARRGTIPAPLLGMCALQFPAVLGIPWIPREVRRRSLEMFYRMGPGAPKFADDVVRGLVQSDLCRKPD